MPWGWQGRSPSLHLSLQHGAAGVNLHLSQQCQLQALTKLQTINLEDGGGYKKPTRSVRLCLQHSLTVNR